jgi:hypothetical protein
MHSGQFNLRTDIAEPLQDVTEKLRPLAERDQTYTDAHNSLCKVLDEFHNRLLNRTGRGLDKNWEKI